MSSLETTLSLLLLMALGFFFRNRISSKDQREGVRIIILSLALPATIFIALVKVNFTASLIIIPVLALVFNLVMFALISRLPLQSMFHIPDQQYRTLVLLLPSLAPGLSCFPFILEYSGEDKVALAALADLGNKIFVLIIAYVIAMRWYFRLNSRGEGSGKVNIKDVVRSLINEPVNTVIAVAILMLAFGLNYTSLPGFLRAGIDKVSLLMTPLVLLFIGMSIRLTWQQVKTIFSFLLFRSGIAFLMSGLLLWLLPPQDLATALLIVVFPQSATSFWPYSHMAAVSGLENKQGEQRVRTFDLDFAMNVLGCSMPFSVVMILFIYTTGDLFTRTVAVTGTAGLLILLALLPGLLPIFRTVKLAHGK
ncbi:MAG: permease [Cyclobacteriaceae bacterium]|nr:permease [Cyclobacteriaceae bacterium]